MMSAARIVYRRLQRLSLSAGGADEGAAGGEAGSAGGDTTFVGEDMLTGEAPAALPLEAGVRKGCHWGEAAVGGKGVGGDAGRTGEAPPEMPGTAVSKGMLPG